MIKRVPQYSLKLFFIKCPYIMVLSIPPSLIGKIRTTIMALKGHAGTDGISTLFLNARNTCIHFGMLYALPRDKNDDPARMVGESYFKE